MLRTRTDLGYILQNSPYMLNTTFRLANTDAVDLGTMPASYAQTVSSRSTATLEEGLDPAALRDLVVRESVPPVHRQPGKHVLAKLGPIEL